MRPPTPPMVVHYWGKLRASGRVGILFGPYFLSRRENWVVTVVMECGGKARSSLRSDVIFEHSLAGLAGQQQEQDQPTLRQTDSWLQTTQSTGCRSFHFGVCCFFFLFLFACVPCRVWLDVKLWSGWSLLSLSVRCFIPPEAPARFKL